MSQIEETPRLSTDVSPEDVLTPAVPIEPVIVRDPYFALRFHNFRLLFFGTFISTVGQKMLEVAIGWELYQRTGSALVLGGVGLALVIPVFCFSLPAGHVADRVDRQRIIIAAQSLMVIATVGLSALSYFRGPLVLIYVCLFLMGTTTAFGGPAGSAFSSQIVPEIAYENAATWSSSSWQLASVIGPALGGLLIALVQRATLVYVLDSVAAFTFVILLLLLRDVPKVASVGVRPKGERAASLRSVMEGIGFLRATPIILGAITLDMFAVLLGGATTLLPIYAQNILHVGPAGLGWLRAAPSIGAVCVAFTLAHRPPFKRAGRTLLLAVAGFGLATIIFGLSQSFWLSLAMLFLLGGLDNISVVIRGTLLLVRTPDAMRGRVAAVNTLFLGASNELGGFESGLTAQFLGPMASVVGGGIGTVLVVLIVALLVPELRRLTTLRVSEKEA